MVYPILKINQDDSNDMDMQKGIDKDGMIVW